ncbi:Protein of unknown function [Micromonospora lupini str. Lupac 08]|uniref:Uncharacterized protein n=1 Tax=Micromonospora lupini str. Lupac 08 TaxID=1150864 RepID=I0L742_9ACTN|nr:Protein of unknown function [Micromonospora lupini str. Lupac 08]
MGGDRDPGVRGLTNVMRTGAPRIEVRD